MSRIAIWLAVLALLLGFATPSMAIDGVVLITQAKALSGNVTPGDAAGFPVTLSRAGSYRLASNLIPGTDKTGIVAAAPDITIDLNGFVMSGGSAGGTNNAITGILGLGDRLTVQNGKINSFEQYGISYSLRQYLIVENLRIINNTIGIYNPDGENARIQNNTIATNVVHGILCGHGCHVEGNVISGNGGNGIVLLSGTVLGNTIRSNALEGIYNVSTADDVGYGNNTLISNGGPQVRNATPMQPKVCSPAC